MICINIIFKNSSITLPLHFKGYKDAEKVHKLISNCSVKMETIEDDYGTLADLDGGDISGVILIDLAKEMDRQGELQIMQARASEKAQAAYKSGSKILQPVPAGLVS